MLYTFMRQSYKIRSSVAKKLRRLLVKNDKLSFLMIFLLVFALVGCTPMQETSNDDQ